MKIENLRKEHLGDRARVVATVVWENCDRPTQDIYFETTSEFADDLNCNPNAFLAACAIPAMRFGEQRIAIDAPICPQLKAGLITIMHCLIDWYENQASTKSGVKDRQRRIIPIEAPLQTQPDFVAREPRAGGFFSGGIDALAMFRTNHLEFSREHPRFLSDGILVYGILNGEDDADANFQHVIDAVARMTHDADINLITVSSNAYSHIRDLDPDFKFWKQEYQACFLAAVAHAFSSRFSDVAIASTYDLPYLIPWGSHPIIDPKLSSAGLQIHHENIDMSRLDKTKVVADWDVALRHLRVCNEKSSYQHGNYNCGKCGKCVRTMAALVALDKLEETVTFRQKTLSKELFVKSVHLGYAYGEANCTELIPLLKQQGRDDLVDAINIVVRRYHEQDLAGLLKRLDRTMFNGRLISTSRRMLVTLKQLRPSRQTVAPTAPVTTVTSTAEARA